MSRPPRQQKSKDTMAAVREDVYQRLRTLLAERLGADEEEITWETSVYDDLNADVIEFHDEIIQAIEEEFGVVVEDEDVPDLTTVRALVAYIVEAI